MLKKCIDTLGRHYKTTALFLGLVSASAFPPFFLLPVLLLAQALMFGLADKAWSYRRAAALGYWYGFGLFAAGFYWIGNALLIDVETFGWLYPIALIASGAFFGLFTIVPFLIWHAFAKPWAKIVAFAAGWVLCEWLRSFVLTGFPWNLLGTVWAFDITFIQGAAIFGTYGLSFLTIVLSGCVYALFRKQRIIGLVLLILIPAIMYGYGVQRLKSYDAQESDIVIRLVQPSIPQTMKWNQQMLEDNFNQYVEMSRKSGWEKADFVIWGETATPFDLDSREFYRRRISQAVPPNGRLITGVVRFGGEEDDYRPFNSMYVINRQSEVEAYYDKHHLVPFGEYIPFRNYLPQWVRPVANNIADFASGEKLKNIKIADYPMFGALICYEIIFPAEVVSSEDKPSWLVVLTNDGWYGKSAGPYQHLVATQMRAVEEGVTIVRSANSGISAVIGPMGNVVEQIALNEKAVRDIKLPLNLKLSTAYNYYGNRLIVCSMLLMLCVLFLAKLGKNLIKTKKAIDF